MEKLLFFSHLATAAMTYKLLLGAFWEEGSGLFMPNHFRAPCSKTPKQELTMKHKFKCFAEWGWNIPSHLQVLMSQDLIFSPNYGGRQPGLFLVSVC